MEEILKDVSDFVNGCLGPLGGSGSWPTWVRDFCIQLIATLILFLVIRFFLWKPITKLLESRREAIDKELTDAQAHHEEAVKLEAELKQKYEDSKVEIQTLLKNAEAQGNVRREEIIKEAKLEADRRIALAEEEIAYEVSKKENDIKDQIVTIAFMAAEKIIGKEVDRDKYLKTVKDIIDGGMKHE